MNQLKIFFTAFLLIPFIDYLWIGLFMKPFYMQELGSHRRMVDGEFKPLPTPAVLVYVLLAFALSYFITSRVETWTEAMLSGAILGLTVYGVYDLTNMSTLANYSAILTVTDIAWGTFLCAVVSTITFFEAQWLNG